jgi:nicotinic acid phosphoribosyltransferase
MLAVVSSCLAPAEVAQAKQAAGGFWVLRPDSGDPVEVVLMVGVVSPLASTL